MHKILLAAAVAALAIGAPTVAGAQIVIQAPPIGIAPPPPPPGPPPGPYWRGPGNDWARRHEIREEYRREAWRRDHCVRDYRGEVYCRR